MSREEMQIFVWGTRWTQVWGSDAYYRDERQETEKKGTVEKVGCDVSWA